VTDDEPWHENQGLVVASGVAGLVLVGVLVYAVMRVSDSSVDPPNVVYPDTSVAPTTTFTTPTTTTSYSKPSVQTSEFTPAPAGPPPDAPSGGGDLSPIVETPTTIYNPYATPTSQGSAGHI
jgi:hypothetical protein